MHGFVQSLSPQACWKPRGSKELSPGACAIHASSLLTWDKLDVPYRTDHGFWNSSGLGPWTQNVGSLCLCIFGASSRHIPAPVGARRFRRHAGAQASGITGQPPLLRGFVERYFIAAPLLLVHGLAMPCSTARVATSENQSRQH